MGVYIKGMEMPAGCSSCLFRRTDYLLGLPACTLIFEEIPDGVNWDEKLPECPLTEVPEPHGRLIDESEFFSCIERGIQTISALPLPKDFVELYMQLINDIKTESMKCHTVIQKEEAEE